MGARKPEYKSIEHLSLEERNAIYDQTYRDKHKEKLRLVSKKYREENPEYFAKYRREHAEEMKAYMKAYRKRKKKS